MEMIVSCAVSFVVTAVAGRILIPILRRMKAGQSIREDGPTWHAGKSGTPTMGGLMFIVGIFAAVLVAGWQGMMAGDCKHLYLFHISSVSSAKSVIKHNESVWNGRVILIDISLKTVPRGCPKGKLLLF